MLSTRYSLGLSADGVPTLPLANFANRFSSALLALIKYLRSEEFKKHPKWASRMPFDAPTYDESGSLGHIVRPDIILTKDGPRICELDFVPSGRGWTMDGLVGDSRNEFLDSFGAWYSAMGVDRVYYATGTVTTCRPEADLFAYALSERAGLDIRSINMDEDVVNGVGIVDRLFYRSELRQPERVVGKRVITAEPWLDSKMVFAVVHDRSMDDELMRALGADHLNFLREVMIETHLISDVKAQRPEFFEHMLGQEKVQMHNEHSGNLVTSMRARRHGWLLKNTDVETDTSWGCRGVVLGSRVGEGVWAAALTEGVAPKRKALGRNPIVQAFQASVDFTDLWNAAVAGEIRVPDHERFGMRIDDVARRPAEHAVNARIGAYFLVSHVNDRVIVPKYGAVTLRQDPLAHGAGDARIASFQLA